MAHLPMSCDEYPFASTAEGGGNTVIAEVPKTENDKQGTMLAAFYRKEFNNVGGPAARFTVVVVQ